jgi:fibronectin type 3 domain-containing protein/TolB-like protein
MRRLLCFISLLALLGSGNAFAVDSMRPKLACFPLAAKSIDAMAYNENISAQLVNSIERTGFVELVERKKIEMVIEQQGLRLDTLDQAKLREFGAQAGFDYILTGLVGRNEGKLFIELSLIGTHTKKAQGSWLYKISDSEISQKLEEIAGQIIPKIKELQSADNVVVVVQRAPVPAPPGNLQASGTSRSVRLKWTQSGAENVTGFKIFRSTSADGAYSPLANSSVTSHSDDNLELNDRFYYKVKALGKGGDESDFSGAVSGGTLVVPQPPVFMQIDSNVRSAQLSWYQRPVLGADPLLVPVSYRVYRSQADKGDYQQVSQISSGSTTYTDAPLLEGAAYRYYLTSLNSAGGESEQSATLEVTTVEAMGELSAVSGNIRKIALSWKQHPLASIEGYHVYRSAAQEGPFEKIGRTASRDATSFLDLVDADNCLRWYRVAGINKDGIETLPGKAVSATTRAVPPAPASPRVSSGEPRRATVSWSALGSAEDEGGGYWVYRSAEEKGDFARIAKVAEKVLSYQDNAAPLKDNAPYWYRVAAINGAGIEGLPSLAAKGVTKANPLPPQGVSAKSGEVRKVTLSWLPNKETDIHEYRVWRKKKEPAGTYAFLEAAQTTGYVETGLGDGVSAAYGVTAVDNDGLESVLSQPVEAMTERAPSRASGARPELRDGQSGIAWDKNPESDIKTYYVYRKSFLGRQKLGETSETRYFYDAKDKHELFVTAVNADGLESEPSATVTLENH